MSHKRRAPWWIHSFVWIGAFVMVVAASAATVTQLTINRVNDSVATSDLLGENRADFNPDDIKGPLNFLVLGVDKEDDGFSRADTVMIAHISEDLDKTYLVSLPRDLYVEVADCGSGFPCQGKLNSSASRFQDWDKSQANILQTITNLTGVKFHGAVHANFDGFMDLIDLIGEVELCPWHDITSIHGDKKTYPAGCDMYDKEDALDLVRQRYGWDSDEDYANGTWGDFGRQKMQQQAIMNLLQGAKDKGYHKDPVKAVEMLDGIGSNLTVDLGEVKLTDFIVALRGLDPKDMKQLKVPSEAQDIGSQSFVVMNEMNGQKQAADELWEAIQNDTLDDWIAQNPDWVNE
ncbi:LCP family protein [Salininema proteolyticum]|uniref:LCP family protein n=1 Tax=Salininema proteolyticum TaxID=1607685 RepID=A0ABV8TWK7_9ACTN